VRPRATTAHEPAVVHAFKQRNVLTLAELSAMLHCSNGTVRRRLKEWRALSSYNNNGRYYTLPSIPRFDKKGLWKHQGVFFSKHGTLKNTIIHLVHLSAAGLSNAELKQILGTDPTSYLAQRKQLGGLKAEKHNREAVYFSAEEQTYRRQKQNRFPPEPTALKLPPDAISIIVLVQLIKHPGSTPAELSDMLHHEGYQIGADMIDNLFEHHGLKKKLNMSE